MPAFAQIDQRPPGIKVVLRFSPYRDGALLYTLHRLGGVLAKSQIARLFYQPHQRRSQNPRHIRRGMEHRLRQLWLAGYLNRTKHPAVYWLTRKGAGYVAGLQGKALRGSPKLVWVAKPNFHFLIHDIGSVDLCLDLIESCQRAGMFELVEMRAEHEFRTRTDRMLVTNRRGRVIYKGYIPDGFLNIKQGKDHYLFFLEYDRDTEDCTRFVFEKVLPFIQYVKTRRFRERFGGNMGRMLIVTTNQRHLLNLKKTTERYAGRRAKWFLFALRAQVSAQSGLPAPIWLQGTRSETSAISAFMA